MKAIGPDRIGWTGQGHSEGPGPDGVCVHVKSLLRVIERLRRDTECLVQEPYAFEVSSEIATCSSLLIPSVHGKIEGRHSFLIVGPLERLGMP